MEFFTVIVIDVSLIHPASVLSVNRNNTFPIPPNVIFVFASLSLLRLAFPLSILQVYNEVLEEAEYSTGLSNPQIVFGPFIIGIGNGLIVTIKEVSFVHPVDTFVFFNVNVSVPIAFHSYTAFICAAGPLNTPFPLVDHSYVKPGSLGVDLYVNNCPIHTFPFP